MFYCVYVLLSKKDKELYIGFTDNLKRRIIEHNKGNNESTKDRLPLELIYTECYQNEKDARKREKYLKTGWGRNYLRKTLSNYLNESKI